MHRVILSGLVALAALGFGATTAVAGAAITRSSHFLVTFPPVTYAAGAVCPFTLELTHPLQHVYETDYFDASGALVESTFTGPLLAEFTNQTTGAAVERNLSGGGSFIYKGDGSITVAANGHLGAAFFQGDTPSGEYLVFSGQEVVTISPSHILVLSEMQGTVENICQTLAS